MTSSANLPGAQAGAKGRNSSSGLPWSIFFSALAGCLSLSVFFAQSDWFVSRSGERHLAIPAAGFLVLALVAVAFAAWRNWRWMHEQQRKLKCMAEILSIVDPNSFGRAQRLKDRIGPLGRSMGLTNVWELELAAMLSQIGHVTIPSNVTAKSRSPQALTMVERELLESVPEIGRKLLKNIPRLQNVAEIVLYQHKHYNGNGFPLGDISGEAIPVGSRMLLILQDLLQLEDNGASPNVAVDQLAKRQGRYDPKLLELLAKSYAGKVWRKEELIRRVSMRELQVGDTLVTDVFNQEGVLLMTSGHKLSGATLEKLLNFAQLYGVKEPLSVY